MTQIQGGHALIITRNVSIAIQPGVTERDDGGVVKVALMETDGPQGS